MEHLPSKLSSIISELLKDSTIVNFNVFVGKNSKIVIYFDSDNTPATQSMKYKLKSQKQANRDKQRAANHQMRQMERNHDNGNLQDISDVQEVSNIVIPNSVQDKECLRANNSSTPDIHIRSQSNSSDIVNSKTDCTSSKYQASDNVEELDQCESFNITPPSFPMNCSEEMSTPPASATSREINCEITSGDQYFIKIMSKYFCKNEEDIILTPDGTILPDHLQELFMQIDDFYEPCDNDELVHRIEIT